MAKKLLLLFLITMISTFVHAEEEDTHFDALVKELKTELHQEEAPIRKRDSYDDPQIHFGGALAGSFVSTGDNGSPSGSAMLTGFDFHFGVDLYSPHWVAEGGYRNFGPQKMASNFSASLQEFEVTIVHKSDLQRNLLLRLGGGLSARYLRTTDNHGATGTDQSPDMVALVGLDRVLTPRVSLGPDISLRSPLVHDTAERTSFDASLRLDFHF